MNKNIGKIFNLQDIFFRFGLVVNGAKIISCALFVKPRDIIYFYRWPNWAKISWLLLLVLQEYTSFAIILLVAFAKARQD